MQIIFVIIFLSWHSWWEGIFPIQNVSIRWYILSKEKNHCRILFRIFEKNPCSKLSLVSTTLIISSRICPNKIYASTVKIWFTDKRMLRIYMISVTAKYKCRSSASKKGFLKTIQLARNILNQLQVKFLAYHLLHAMRSGILGTEHLDWHSCKCTCYPQSRRYAIVFQNVLASNQRAVTACCGRRSNVQPTHLLWELPVDQETARHIWQCCGKVVSATLCPARTRIKLATYGTSSGCNKVSQVLASTTCAQRCANGC